MTSMLSGGELEGVWAKQAPCKKKNNNNTEDCAEVKTYLFIAFGTYVLRAKLLFVFFFTLLIAVRAANPADCLSGRLMTLFTQQCRSLSHKPGRHGGLSRSGTSTSC